MVLEETVKSLENEIAFRKGIELKINEMSGAVIQSKTSEKGFKLKLENLQEKLVTLTEDRDNLLKEVILLRSFKEKAFMKYAEYDG